ncbi:MAG TPA: DUF4136 domain-containing protein, partial [Vicinamibacterales bacterium]|nr:DUF4136 domain-containing protein [Vicinamibacterales bacterium]
MTKTRVVAALLFAAVSTATMASRTKYRVQATMDPQADFSKITTYSWLPSHIVADQEADGFIVAAIDRELQAAGLTLTDSDSSDVVVTYAAYSRTDVNVNAKEIDKDVRPSYPVGILIVRMLVPKTLRQVLELRAVTPFAQPELRSVIDQTVQAMFKRYPRRSRG